MDPELRLLGEKGITFEPSPPYTQHKNGTAERMIRTLNTKAQSMMCDANVPTKFFPEAIRTACYLHRRSSTSSLSGNRSPYEALYGTIPKTRHFRRFGCRVYKHIPAAQRTEKKFGNRSSVCMMLGSVHNTTKIWRIWDFNSGRTGRAVECSSVVFQVEENAHTEEQITAVEFLENAGEFHQDRLSRLGSLSRQENSPSRQENSPPRQDSPSRQENSPSRQDNSKSKTTHNKRQILRECNAKLATA